MDHGTDAVGVLEGVRQGLLHDPVRRGLSLADHAAGAALLGELHRMAGPSDPLDQGVKFADGRWHRLGPIVRVEQVEQMP